MRKYREQEMVAYTIDPISSNSMKSTNPHSGIHETTVSRCLDATFNDPSCNQGGNVICYSADARNGALNEEISGTLQSHSGGGYSLNCQNPICYALQANGIDRAENAGCGGKGYRVNESYTLNTIDRHAVAFDMTAIGEYGNGDKASTMKERDYKDATDLVIERRRKYIVRRLTPLECCRLQGFPDDWCDGVKGSDTDQYRLWGNGMALPNMLFVIQRIKEHEEGTI